MINKMPLEAEDEHISIQASQRTVRLQNGDAHCGVKIDHRTLPSFAEPGDGLLFRAYTFTILAPYIRALSNVKPRR